MVTEKYLLMSGVGPSQPGRRREGAEAGGVVDRGADTASVSTAHGDAGQWTKRGWEATARDDIEGQTVSPVSYVRERSV